MQFPSCLFLTGGLAKKEDVFPHFFVLACAMAEARRNLILEWPLQVPRRCTNNRKKLMKWLLGDV